MAKRSRLTRGASASSFRRSAGAHPRNLNLSMPMRGGIRL